MIYHIISATKVPQDKVGDESEFCVVCWQIWWTNQRGSLQALAMICLYETICMHLLMPSLSLNHTV